MKRHLWECDECGHGMAEARVRLRGKWASGKAGILLPRWKYHFCSKECLVKWLGKAVLQQS